MKQFLLAVVGLVLACFMTGYGAQHSGVIMETVTQMELPLMPADIDDLYVDQAMVNGSGFFAAYTPWGVKQIDSLFCRRIQNLIKTPEDIERDIQAELECRYFPSRPIWDGKVTPEDLKREFVEEERAKFQNDSPNSIRNDILSNEHLHACIKENLLFNLDNYTVLWEKLMEAEWTNLLQVMDTYIATAPEENNE